MNKSEFKEVWEMLSDKKRVTFLRQQARDNFKPEFLVYVDNDSVFVTFKDEEDYDDPTILEFDEYGYHLLVLVFQSVGINADFV